MKDQRIVIVEEENSLARNYGEFEFIPEQDSPIELLSDAGHTPFPVRWASYTKPSECETFPTKTPDMKFSHKVLEFLAAIFEFLMVPSFVRRNAKRESEAPSRLAALDGIRGIASFGVFIFHFSFSFLPPEDKYGYGSSEEHRKWYQLPFVHTLYTGPGWVGLFWLLSGYVLSKKPIQLIREQDPGLLEVLSSMVFRRGIRLFLPSSIAMVFSFCLMRLGAFEPGRRNVKSSHELFAQPTPPPPFLHGFWEQLIDYARDCAELSNAWNSNITEIRYNPSLWTISIEFYGSMVLAIVIVGIANLKTWTRITVLTTLICSTIYAGEILTMLFIVGIFIVELEFLIQNCRIRPCSYLSADSFILAHDDSNQPRKSIGEMGLARRAALFTPFVLGWFLIGTPLMEFDKTPGFQTLALFINSASLWRKMGAVFLLCGILMSPDAHWLCTRPLVLYLGRISYALYIVHVNVIFIVLYAILPAVWRVTGGKETKTQFALGYLISAVATWPLTFWLADLFWRGVDIPSVKFAKWIEVKLRQEKKRSKRF